MGKVAELKHGRRGRPRSKGKGSDDSDEDYLVEEDEDYMNEDDEDKIFEEDDEHDDVEHYYCDSFDIDDKSEEKFDGSVDEEEMSRSAQSKRWRSGLTPKKLGTQVSNNQRSAQRRHMDSDHKVQNESFEVAEEEEEMNEATVSNRRSYLDKKRSHRKPSNSGISAHQENDDEDYNVEEEEEDDSGDQIQKFEVYEEDKAISEATGPNINMSCFHQKKLRNKASNNRRDRQSKIDDDDYNFDEEEDDEDEELDESVSLEEEEEEEELVVKKMKRNNIKRTLRKKSSGSRKKKRAIKVASKVSNKRKQNSIFRRKLGSDDGDGDGDDDDDGDEEFISTNLVKKGRSKKKQRRGTRKFTLQSDSDFVDSGPSETEFTISEEEREQVREASKICRNSSVSLMSSCSYNIQDNEAFAQRRKPFVTKGKEKVQDIKNEVVKQMCGICFSEEGKNTVRGKLNCCSHYFCFTCIMEWSKVETRCPLCKQRFLTIIKSSKANSGLDLRDVVLQIPERDQVYQPTEEEIRGYIDPYENVMCTECHEGGDDELMLLCDLCDSPAHTYCVGLGREVPEGNWYCEGCRPASFGSSNNQIQDSLRGQRNLLHRLSSFDGIQENFDGSFSTLSTQFQQGFSSFPSPRNFAGGIQALSPISETGVVTVSGRRQIHRRIQSMFSGHRTTQAADAIFSISANNFQVNGTHSSQRAPTGTPETGTQLDEESQGLSAAQNIQFIPASSDHFGDPSVLETTPLQGESNIQGVFRPSSISMLPDDTNVGCAYHLSSSLGEGSNIYLEEQLKPLVQNHLTCMSSTLTILDADALQEIARKSISTILAACGYHHYPAEVFPVLLLPQPSCSHIENPFVHTSPMKGNCNACFNNFTREVVKTILNSKLPHFLHLRN